MNSFQLLSYLYTAALICESPRSVGSELQKHQRALDDPTLIEVFPDQHYQKGDQFLVTQGLSSSFEMDIGDEHHKTSLVKFDGGIGYIHNRAIDQLAKEGIHPSGISSNNCDITPVRWNPPRSKSSKFSDGNELYTIATVCPKQSGYHTLADLINYQLHENSKIDRSNPLFEELFSNAANSINQIATELNRNLMRFYLASYLIGVADLASEPKNVFITSNNFHDVKQNYLLDSSGNYIPSEENNKAIESVFRSCAFFDVNAISDPLIPDYVEDFDGHPQDMSFIRDFVHSDTYRKIMGEKIASLPESIFKERSFKIFQKALTWDNSYDSNGPFLNPSREQDYLSIDSEISGLQFSADGQKPILITSEGYATYDSPIIKSLPVVFNSYKSLGEALEEIDKIKSPNLAKQKPSTAVSHGSIKTQQNPVHHQKDL